MEFEELFIKSQGQPINYKGKEIKMVDKIMLSDMNTKVKIEFLSSDSIWTQGMMFKIKGSFNVNGQTIKNQMVLWQDSSPTELELGIKSKDKILIVYNVWKTSDGTMHSWHNGAAMFIEQALNQRIYNCNDGFPDDDFNDLVVRITY